MMGRGRNLVSRLLQPWTKIPYGTKTAAAINVRKNLGSSKSYRLLTDYGIIRSSNSGYFSLLPLGLRSLTKLRRLIEARMESSAVGAQRILLPTLTPGDLWKKTGRWDQMGPELMKVRNRHDKDFVLSPTHEEAVSYLIGFGGVGEGGGVSYKLLPLRLYQISNKFRDEVKPRLGLIRANEFLMKDLYTFDLDAASAAKTYEVITEAYKLFFKDLGVPFERVRGDTGSIGGSLSHEFHFLSEIGEDKLLKCRNCDEAFNEQVLDGESCCPECKNPLISARGIEVAHTFLLGDKYSSVFNSLISAKEGSVIAQMGCYGIGVSRILAAAVECLSTEKEIRWPKSIAPYSVCLIGPKTGSKDIEIAQPLLLNLYDELDSEFRNDVIIDDRENTSIGTKLREAKKTGYPYIVIFGKESTAKENPTVEVHTYEEPFKNINLSAVTEFLLEQI